MKRIRKRRNLTGFLFILPAVLVVGALLLYPVLTSAFYSFTSKHLIKQKWSFVGLDNYVRVLTDKAF